MNIFTYLDTYVFNKIGTTSCYDVTIFYEHFIEETIHNVIAYSYNRNYICFICLNKKCNETKRRFSLEFIKRIDFHYRLFIER